MAVASAPGRARSWRSSLRPPLDLRPALVPEGGDADRAVAELLNAALEGDLPRAKKLAKEISKAGKSVDQAVAVVTGIKRPGPLHLAAAMGKVEMCRLLIRTCEVDVNVTDDDGATPLIFAVQGVRSKAVINFLLSCEADPDKADSNGIAPLHIAAEQDSYEVAELLLSKGAKVDPVCGSGEAPLHVAAENGNASMLKLLMKHNADFNRLTGSLNTPLDVSLFGFSLECLEILIEAGADVNIGTPLVIAADKGLSDCIESLLKAGADANIPNENGKMPIEIAALKGWVECVEILFPVTTPIAGYADWSIDAITPHGKTEHAAGIETLMSGLGLGIGSEGKELESLVGCTIQDSVLNKIANSTQKLGSPQRASTHEVVQRRAEDADRSEFGAHFDFKSPAPFLIDDDLPFEIAGLSEPFEKGQMNLKWLKDQCVLITKGGGSMLSGDELEMALCQVLISDKSNNEIVDELLDLVGDSAFDETVQDLLVHRKVLVNEIKNGLRMSSSNQPKMSTYATQLGVPCNDCNEVSEVYFHVTGHKCSPSSMGPPRYGPASPAEVSTPRLGLSALTLCPVLPRRNAARVDAAAHQDELPCLPAGASRVIWDNYMTSLLCSCYLKSLEDGNKMTKTARFEKIAEEISVKTGKIIKPGQVRSRHSKLKALNKLDIAMKNPQSNELSNEQLKKLKERGREFQELLDGKSLPYMDLVKVMFAKDK